MNDAVRTSPHPIELTISQYQQPSKAYLPVQSYITPEQFDEYGSVAKALGFKQAPVRRWFGLLIMPIFRLRE